MTRFDRALVVIFDVSNMTETQIDNLRFSALVQCEADVGLYPHPDAAATSHVVDDLEVEAGAAARTWPTADELRAEGRDPDTGLVRDPDSIGSYNPTTGEPEFTS